MKTFLITSNYEYEIGAKDKEDAIEKWGEGIEDELASCNETIATRFSESLVANEIEKIIEKKEEVEHSLITNLLEKQGYSFMDITETGQSIFRKGSIDIIVEVIDHKDNL